ncbi:hypothetical protein INT48_000627 [Thamnidium elegans]|uniref:Uncharacterized protein n=1 Tax=Thamnidium elegans TaxID=101142 RepID=A0A8H7SH81_9FUNG|nr:hypothetical protein INT48_000627 [Thamnidium elegans]
MDSIIDKPVQAITDTVLDVPSPVPPISTTTEPPVTSLKPVVTSTPVPIVTVSKSGDSVITYTSTSYSSYETSIPTVIDNPDAVTEKSSNTGAIVGGVVGGIAAIAIIGFIFFLLKRRGKKKSYADDDLRRSSINNNAHPFDDFNNTYGSPTVVGSDNNSVPGSRPLSMSTNVGAMSGAKPRPFVQAYQAEPNMQQYAAYDNTAPQGDYQQQQQYYYQDYQQNPGNQQYTYAHDPYYAQVEPMIPMSTSSHSSNGRNVPNEVDYQRHVPDEVDSTPPQHSKYPA